MAGVFLVVEQIIRIYQRKDLTRIQDLITNTGSAIIFLFSRVLFLGMMIHVYVYLYDHYRIVDMPLHSFWTWFVSLLLVEFVYYWTHRALHELNILWAGMSPQYELCKFVFMSKFRLCTICLHKVGRRYLLIINYYGADLKSFGKFEDTSSFTA